MIEVTNIVKKYDKFVAVDDISVKIPDGCIFGMVGSNGAGKSTLMRVIAGIYKPEAGEVKYDGRPVYENTAVKENIVYVGDDLYTYHNSSMDRISLIYESAYPKFDRKYYEELKEIFGLNGKNSLASFSKGMKRQAVTILAMACKTDYIMFDETFDGLDPVMRGLVKNLLYKDILERGATAIITSHSLRELEDICDQLALLHKGGLVLQSEIGDLKSSLFKCQVAFKESYDQYTLEYYIRDCEAKIMHYVKHGSVANMIMSGDKEKVLNAIEEHEPLLVEAVPMSLEEIFTYEMELKGYSFDDVFDEKEAN